MSERIKIIIADDQRLMREGLKTIVDLEEDMEVLSTAANGLEAVELCRRFKPDIVLMDIRMPEMDGVEATARITSENLAGGVIVVTTFDDDNLIIDALQAGAKTYLLKDLPSEKLLATIRSTYRGDIVLQPEIAAKLVKRASGQEATTGEENTEQLIEPLTAREKEVLALMAGGSSNSEIAARLYLSEGTIKNQVSNIYSKLGTNDRTRAVLIALKRKLI